MLAWIGFIGIALDFAGVVILTLDILPEFRLHRREQRLRQLRLNTDHLKDGDGARTPREGDDQLYQTIEGALDLVNATNASLYDPVQFNFGTAHAALSNSAYDFDASEDSRVKAALAEPAFDRKTFDEALTVLRVKSDIAHANLAYRRRPNLLWGVTFVLFGFLLQAFGAMPSYAQTLVIDGVLRVLHVPHP
ncbi:hypothetical protein [Rhizobium leguminosarum]|uniref:hypothetical protein n=1 Tax=Rhizobium leguminosarum TaxID=384 RepID=UPI001C91E386|nr:hypothetical protein [Rhizobium leguminosarum]MBY2909242.1 hypothetical protein [Rhizobium leguminosarum]MBY2949081.1 hypothetical protein [Rhizobium leguminosarum]